MPAIEKRMLSLKEAMHLSVTIETKQIWGQGLKKLFNRWNLIVMSLAYYWIKLNYSFLSLSLSLCLRTCAVILFLQKLTSLINNTILV